MAKLLMVVTGKAFYEMEYRKRLDMQRHMKRCLDHVIESEGSESYVFAIPEGIKVQLFKIEDDGVEELISVDVHYHNENGERIEIEEATSETDQTPDENP